MSDTPIILAAIKDLRDTVREDIRGLGARVNGLEIKAGEHGIEIGHIKENIDNLWKGIRRNGHRADGSSKSWLTILELLTAAPKLWHVLIMVATLVGIIGTMIHKFL